MPCSSWIFILNLDILDKVHSSSFILMAKVLPGVLGTNNAAAGLCNLQSLFILLPLVPDFRFGGWFVVELGIVELLY